MAKNKKKVEHVKVVASSESEEYMRKINKQFDIRLGRELRHLEAEKKLFLKNFAVEFKETRGKLDTIRTRLKELRGSQTQERRQRSKKMPANVNGDPFFITDQGKVVVISTE